MRLWRVVYWFVTGAVLGLGVLSFSGEGLILLPVGVVLLLIGLFALRGREATASILGFGAVPEAALINAFVLGAPTTGPAAPFYVGSAIFFGAITLVGLIALVVGWRAPRRDSGPATT